MPRSRDLAIFTLPLAHARRVTKLCRIPIRRIRRGWPARPHLLKNHGHVETHSMDYTVYSDCVLPTMAARVPESLVQQCQFFILMHLDKLSVSHLSLLPLYIRKELLWHLPLADVCQLEGTKFTEGLDMAAYWRYPFDQQGFDIDCWGIDKVYYFHEWGATEYERAVLYGLLTAYTFGSEYLQDGDFYFRSPLLKDGQLDALTFLYAVRRPIESCGPCDVRFPSRYTRTAIYPGRQLDVDEVVRCFGRHKGELPKIFVTIGILHNPNLEYVHFLYEVVYVSFQGYPLENQGLEFVKAVIKEAANLEMFILDQWGEDDDLLSLDEFCNFLSSQISFLSKFRQLKIHCSISFLGFIVAQKSFNQLITAYFAAPTDHMQKLEFSHIKVKCSDDCSPTVDQNYLQFKTIEFDDMCQFVRDATPTAISHWLGQSISKLETTVERGTCLFKVDKETVGCNTQKRKRKRR